MSHSHRRPARPRRRSRTPRHIALEALENRLVMTAPVVSGYANLALMENVVNGSPQLLGPTVTVSDAEGNWDGATLEVSGVLAEDRLGIADDALVTRVGDAVRYDGTAIGAVSTLAGQTGVGEPLLIRFNAAATTAGVQAVTRALSYRDASDTPTAGRRLTVTVTDAGGAASTPERLAFDLAERTGVANPFGAIRTTPHADPAFGDMDGDGDLDLLIWLDDGTSRYYRNDGTNVPTRFVAQPSGPTNPFSSLPNLRSGSPTLGDVDGDGDLDLVVGTWDAAVPRPLYYFRNDGTANAASYVAVTGSANPFNGVVEPARQFAKVALGDLDADGDLDLVAVLNSSNFTYYRNDGTPAAPSYVLQTGAASPLSGISFSGAPHDPALGDVDGDGLIDLLVGANYNTKLQYLRNTGTANAPAFTLQTGAADPFAAGVTISALAPHPALADLDGDGALDAIVGDVAGDLHLFDRGRYSLDVTVTAEPDVAPSITAGGGPVAAIVGGPAVVVDPAVTIDPGTNPTLSKATVSIAGDLDAASDRLLFDAQGGIAGNYDAATGILTLTGTASVAAYQAALRSVRYQRLGTEASGAADRTITFSIARALYSTLNGHYYEFVAAPGISWTAARAAALSSSLFGIDGYLVTFTSQAENDFAIAKAQGMGWMGASDAAVEGEWRWMDGPEAGTEFWHGMGVWWGTQPIPGQYSNWNNGTGEPNNSGDEDYGHFHPWGTWNDYADSVESVNGYMVEYGGLPTDPELQLVSQATVGLLNYTGAPTVASPAGPVSVNTATVPVTGTAPAGSLVQVYDDANANGLLDEGEAVVASQQLVAPGTAFAVDVPLAPNSPNRFVLTATAAGRLESVAVATPTIVSDRLAPAAPRVLSPGSPAAVNAPTIGLTGTAEVGSRVDVYVDANGNGVVDEGEAAVGSQQLGASEAGFAVTVPLTPDAANRFLVVATDAAGNRSSATVVPTITEDSTAPGAPVVQGPAGPTVVNTSSIGITGVAEQGSLVQVFVDSDDDGLLDEGEAVVGRQQLTGIDPAYRITVPLAPNGVNRFRVLVTDATGNLSPSIAVPEITHDSIAPMAPRLGSPLSSTTTDASSIDIAGEAEPGSLVQVFVDANGNGVVDAGEALAGSQQLGSLASSYRVTVPLAPNGINRFLVVTTDPAGNRSAAVQVAPVTQDSTVPQAPVVTGPIGPVAVCLPGITVSGTAEPGSLVRVFDDSDGDGRLDPGEAVVGSQQLAPGQSSYRLTVPLRANATNRLLVATTDAAGHASTPVALAPIVQDSVAPAIARVSRYGYHMHPTSLVVTFTERMDPARAANVANYRLVDPRGRTIRITAARYDAATHAVTLTPATRLDLHKTYRLTVVGRGGAGLADASGNGLAGSGAAGGTDYTTTITRSNFAGLCPPTTPTRTAAAAQVPATPAGRLALDQALAHGGLFTKGARRSR
jgi:hypothetical protein